MRNTVILLIVLLFVNCSNKTENNVKQNNVKQNDIKKDFFEINIAKDFDNQNEFRISSIADTISYIPLETLSKCLISKIINLRIENNHIFIRTERKELFAFSPSGKFLNKIGNRGNGPKEYRTIIHCDIDSNFVYILDYARIIKYKITGQYVKTIKLSRIASRIKKFQNNKFICYIPDSQFKKGENPYSFLVIDQEGDSINSIRTSILRDYSSEKIANNYAIFDFSNEHDFTFKETFNDTLYYINLKSLEIQPFGFLNLGLHKINLDEHYKKVINANHNMRITGLINIHSSLLLQFACQCAGNNTWHWAVYDKRKNHFFTLKDQNLEEKIINDINDGPSFTPFKLTSNNKLIGYVYAYECAEQNTFFTQNGTEIKANDNPIIVIANLKD